MLVKAIRVIRSAHIGFAPHVPGELGSIVATHMGLGGKKLYRVSWQKDNSECECLEADIEILGEHKTEAQLAVSATADSGAPPKTAASSAEGESHPVLRASGSGQEPVGILPSFDHSAFAGWWHPDFDLGGEA